MEPLDYTSIIKEQVDDFIQKRIEIRKNYKELRQLKNNIIYLKRNYGKETSQEFTSKNGTLSILNYKSKYSSLLKKKFKDLSNEEKRKLYKTGLLTIFFRLNYQKFEKLKSDNKKTQLDDYAILRNSDLPYRWNITPSEHLKNELKIFEENLKNKKSIEIIDANYIKAQREKELDDDYIEQHINESRLFWEDVVNDEMHFDASYFSDDASEDISDIENQEKGLNYYDDDEEEEEY